MALSDGEEICMMCFWVTHNNLSRRDNSSVARDLFEFMLCPVGAIPGVLGSQARRYLTQRRFACFVLGHAKYLCPVGTIAL
jgi:hypothetical protein